MDYFLILVGIIVASAILRPILLRKRDRAEKDELEMKILAMRTELAIIGDRHCRDLEEQKYKTKLEYDNWMLMREKHIRADAIAKSRSVIRGQATEHFAPFLMNSGLDPKDFRFFAAPIDFVVFDGLSKVRAGEADDLERIIFLDIKTGGSGLSKVQKAIERAVDSGSVDFMVFNPDDKQNDAE